MEKLPNHDALEHAVNNFVNKEKPDQNDINFVRIQGNLQRKMLEFEAQSKNMSINELIHEKHNSSRLANNMAANGEPRPSPLCHCHAMVSGGHEHAAIARAIIARCKIRKDSYRNGCWLPENTKAVPKMPAKLRRAVPHSRIHRHGYYTWLRSHINIDTYEAGGEKEITQRLSLIKQQLETSTFPEYVMLKAAEVRKLEARNEIPK